jgi:GTP 3',8-cyclase
VRVDAKWRMDALEGSNTAPAVGEAAVNDGFARSITYLRLSLTDQCNLRCRYCMPDEGMGRAANEELLTAAEIELVVRAAVRVGIEKVRLTGGEPTLRGDIVEIVRSLAAVPGMRELVMTTNGIRLATLAVPLTEAGLRRVNIHLDSLDTGHLRVLSGAACLHKVWAGVEAAERVGLVPIKINSVVVRGCNELDVIDMARLTLERDWQVRFIELMPLGEPARFALDRYVSSQETRAQIESALGPLLPMPGGELAGDGSLYRLAGGRGSLGFISPVSHSYCDRCNHIRVTSDGRIRPCLLLDEEFNLRQVLRAGGTVDDLAGVFRRAVVCKPQRSLLAEGVYPAARPMAGIGG